MPKTGPCLVSCRLWQHRWFCGTFSWARDLAFFVSCLVSWGFARKVNLGGRSIRVCLGSIGYRTLGSGTPWSMACLIMFRRESLSSVAQSRLVSPGTEKNACHYSSRRLNLRRDDLGLLASGRKALPPIFVLFASPREHTRFAVQRSALVFLGIVGGVFERKERLVGSKYADRRVLASVFFFFVFRCVSPALSIVAPTSEPPPSLSGCVP